MNIDKRIAGHNFHLAREKLGLSLQILADSIGVVRETVSSLERGKGKYFKINLATKYYNYICELPSFPSGLKFEDFISINFFEQFNEKHSKSTTDNFPIGEVSEYGSMDISKDTSTVPASIVNTLPAGLKEFLNDEWEIAGMNPTEEEIKILEGLHPKWRASEEYFRFSLQDLRRSKKNSKHKAAGDNCQSVMPQLKLEFWDRTFSHFLQEKNDAQNAQKFHSCREGGYSSPAFYRKDYRIGFVRRTESTANDLLSLAKNAL